MKTLPSTQAPTANTPKTDPSRRITIFLALVIVFFLLILSVTLIHDAYWRGRLKVAENVNAEAPATSIEISTPSLPTPVPEKPTSETLVPVLATVPESASTNLGELYPDLLPAGEIFVSPSTSGRIALVDLGRIAAALPPPTTAQAREKELAQIRRAVAAVAAAEDFSYVFDRTATNLYATPVILYDNGTPDLTDLVLQKFKK